ncbi:MAG: hypothetical protein ACRCV0_07400, partial [Brevinema sp.]
HKHQADPAEFEESEDTLQHNTMEAHTLDHEISLDQHKHQTDPAEFEESEDTLQHNTMEAHTLDHEISLDQHKHQADPAEFEESEDTLQHNTMEAHTLDHEISLDQHKHQADPAEFEESEDTLQHNTMEAHTLDHEMSVIDLVAQDKFTSELDQEINEMTKEFERIDLETINQVMPHNSNELDEFNTETEDLNNSYIDIIPNNITNDTMHDQINDQNLRLNQENKVKKENNINFLSSEGLISPEYLKTNIDKITHDFQLEKNDTDHSLGLTSSSLSDKLTHSIGLNSSPSISLSNKELRSMMKEIDELLEFLPDEKIEELSQKKFYHLYIKLLDELGL